MRIRVSKWTDSNTVDPDIIVLESVDGAVWHDVDTPDAVAELSDVLFVAEDGALRVDFEDGSPDPWLIAANLPLQAGRGPDYAGAPETGDPELDDIDDFDGGFRVLINGERWGNFETSSGGGDETAPFWGPCKPPHNTGRRARLKARRLVAQWSEFEEDSMVSGTIGWLVYEVDDQRVCFRADLDEDGYVHDLQERAGRSDRELLGELSLFANQSGDAPGAKAGLAAAAKNGGVWEGYLNELNPEFSETCWGAATVNLMSDGPQS